jgi:hypothetical protein
MATQYDPPTQASDDDDRCGLTDAGRQAVEDFAAANPETVAAWHAEWDAADAAEAAERANG